MITNVKVPSLINALVWCRLFHPGDTAPYILLDNVDDLILMRTLMDQGILSRSVLLRIGIRPITVVRFWRQERDKYPKRPPKPAKPDPMLQRLAKLREERKIREIREQLEIRLSDSTPSQEWIGCNRSVEQFYYNRSEVIPQTQIPG